MNKLFRFYSMFSKWYSVVITKSVGCEQDIVRVQYGVSQSDILLEGSCLNAASFGPPIPTTVGSLWNCGEFHVVQDASSVDASPLV